MYIGNDVASSVSILDIQTLTQQPPNPVTGGGLSNPMRIIALGEGTFILNGNDTLTRIVPGADVPDPDPDPISGGGMSSCRDVCYGLVNGRSYIWVTNADSNSITRIAVAAEHCHDNSSTGEYASCAEAEHASWGHCLGYGW